TLMLQGLEIDEATNNQVPQNTQSAPANDQIDPNNQTTPNNRLDYITGILKSRALMYRNRDIVNGQDEDYDEYLSQDYLLGKLNEVNFESNFNTNNVDNTSTTHFVVVDKEGKVTSTTNTLSSFFGSGEFMKEGFYMNNSLSNFSSDPLSPNHGGKHKTPRSYTAPSIVVGPDYYMGIGTPGGNKIPTTTNEVLIDYLKGNGTLQESIDKPRFYNDGGTVFYENAMSKADVAIFKSLGFKVEEKRNDPNFGSVQAALYNKNDKTVEIGHDVGNR
ncbi:MAG: gamma-glutamyltransferase, partial [Staphylococcus equorum]|nr:gamma-glutamyltransferase [Staphylococcus equorum]